MRRMRPVVMLMFALVSGGLAAALALRYIRARSSTLSAQAPARGGIVVATRAMSPGSIIGPRDVAVVPWQAGAIPAGFITSPEQAVGRGLVTSLALNEPLLEGKLAAKGAGGGLPVMIDDGMRAMSVKVDEVIGVAGFVLPGTRVDVLVTIPNSSDESKSISRVILQNVRTLAAGASVEQDAEGKPKTVTVITLLVSPEDAELLSLAANQGRLQLALRNTQDTTSIVTAGIKGNDLRGSAPAAPVLARRSGGTRTTVVSVPRSQETIVEGYKGGVRTLTTFGQR